MADKRKQSSSKNSKDVSNMQKLNKSRQTTNKKSSISKASVYSKGVKKTSKKKNSSSGTSQGINRRVVTDNILLMLLLFCGMTVGVAGYAIYKVATCGEEYTKGALNNMVSDTKIIAAPRGVIEDRENRPLANSLIAYDVELSPYELMENVSSKVREKTYNILGTYLPEYTAEEIKQKVEEKYAENNNSKYLPLASEIELDDKAYKSISVLGGVTCTKVYTRNYPGNELAAQVIGFYNDEGQGQYGIEEKYNDYLTGKEGRIYPQFSENDVVTKGIHEETPGATITTTIDISVQQYIAEAMRKYIKEYNPKSATAIVMNPNTAEIYGMYSYPEVNLNNYSDLSEQVGEDKWSDIEKRGEMRLEAWRNHAIQYNYEPGSTFKPLLVSMALDEGIISPNSTYNCQGAMKVADTTIHCWNHSGHGVQSVSVALANSCNVAMMEIAAQIDDNIFLDYMQRFGFGNKTGIGLTGEEEGILHTKDSFGPVQKATSSIGQTFTVTPIQLITAFSSVINGGDLLEPYVVSEITSANGESLFKHDERVVKRQVISKEVADTVRDALKKVVDEGGTGTTASIPGYSIGGKTGTGQKFIDGTNKRDPDNYVVSFMGFAPVENPQIVALIVFDNMPEHTGAPTMAFKDMMENIFPYFGIPTTSEANINNDVEEENTIEVPDLKGNIYDAITKLDDLGFKYTIRGNGTNIYEQYPVAKDKWPIGGEVVLYTNTTDLSSIVEVPNLTGHTLEEAKEIVGDKFTIEGNTASKITNQIPPAGTKIEKGNKIIVQTN